MHRCLTSFSSSLRTSQNSLLLLSKYQTHSPLFHLSRSLSTQLSPNSNFLRNKQIVSTLWYSGGWGNQPGFHSSSSHFAPKIQPFLLTDVGEGIAEVEILSFLVKEGDEIEEYEPVCEVQSDKAVAEITSRYSGKVAKVYYKKGDIAKVGKPLIDVEISDTKTDEIHTATESKPAPSSSPCASSPSEEDSLTMEIRSSSGTRKVLATPAVRRLASEHKLSLSSIPGSGKDGRVTKADILLCTKQGSQPTKPTPTPPSKSESTPVLQIPVILTAEDHEVPIRGYGRAMVKTMTLAAKVPHFGYCDEIQVDGLIQLKNSIQKLVQKEKIKITVMPIFIKALSLALKTYPIINSQFQEERMALIYKGSHNVGVAMDTPSGLVVPNIKNCETKSIIEIAKELTSLIELAKQNKLTAEQLTGGTITLSNVGTIGGTYLSPVLNLPEVAIGALGKIQKVPRFDEKGNVVPVQIVQISWSADHRVLDGATVARFSTLFKNYIENPSLMLMDSR